MTAENSEAKDGYISLGVEFEISLQSIVAEKLQSQGGKPNRKNMLAFKRKAEGNIPYRRENGTWVAGSWWGDIQHKAAKLTYSRITRRSA